MKKRHIRVQLDDANEKLGYRLRSSQMRKIPYTIVIGDKEKEEGTVTYRKFGQKDQITVSLEEFLKMLEEEISSRSM